MDNLREGRYAALGQYILMQDREGQGVVVLDRWEMQPGDANGVVLHVVDTFWSWDDGMDAMRKLVS